MDLNTVWFMLVAILFIGFFFLEGFDFGVGTLLPFLGKDDEDRRVIVNTIGPFWDGNEVWLITAGGAIFAAFPHWYATMFSGFYIALVLMLFALIARGVAFEFRSKGEGATWRMTWDRAIFIGSLLPGLLWGVAVANLMLGVPIDASKNYVGGFFNLLNPYALLGGATFVALFTLHGAVFLILRTEGDLLDRARRVASWLWLPAVALAVLFLVGAYLFTDIIARPGALGFLVAGLAAVSLLSAGWFMRQRRDFLAFAGTGLTIILVTAMVFLGMYPRVMISNLDPAWSLTIQNASSSPYTLQVMTIVAVIFVPIVLIYEGWTYWVFRHRVSRSHHLHY